MRCTLFTMKMPFYGIFGTAMSQGCKQCGYLQQLSEHLFSSINTVDFTTASYPPGQRAMAGGPKGFANS